MPKNFKFTGLRKYDPTATVQEKEYSEGMDYCGADTQVFLRDTVKDKPDVRIYCFRNLSGGKLFRDMRDTSCYGQSHKSYMPGQDDSEPVQITISALSDKALTLCFDTWKNKKTIWMTIIYPDGRYIKGLVRIESIDFDTPIDSVFQYIVTFRRVSDQDIDTGLFYVIYELRDCEWADTGIEERFTKRAYYRKDETVEIPTPDSFKGPFEDVTVNRVDVYNTLTGQLIEVPEDRKITIKSNVRVVPRYSASKIDLVVVWNKEGLVTGKARSTSKRITVGDMYTLPSKDEAEKNAQLTGYRLTGWMINGDKEKVKAPGDDIPVTADLQKIVAVWKAVYKLTYSDGGHATTKLPEESVHLAGDKVILSTEVPEYAGGDNHQYWKFTGWVDPANSEPYKPGAEITIPPARNVELNAQWKPRYKIIYDCGDATAGGPGPKDEAFYDADASVWLMDGTGLTKDGHKFGGWFRVGDPTTVYEAGKSYKVGTTNNATNHDITFKVHWVNDTAPGIDEEPEETEEIV